MSEPADRVQESRTEDYWDIAYPDAGNNDEWTLSGHTFTEKQARDKLKTIRSMWPDGKVDWRVVRVTKSITINEVPE